VTAPPTTMHGDPPPRPRLLALPGAMLVRAVWQYRGFVWGMVSREFQARYRYSLLGSAWAVLNPAAMIAIYTVVFSQVMRARLPGVDDSFAYSIYICAGLLPWTFFAEVIARSLSVFFDNAALLKKVSFPRISLPVVLLLSSTVNFVIIFGLFLLVLVFTGRFPGWVVVALAPLLVIQQAFALGLGILFGVLNVFFRDVGQLVGVAMQFWFWLTPIVYSAAILSDRVRAALAWNPLTRLVGAYQQILVAGTWPDWSQFRVHAVAAVVVLGLAFIVFDRLSAEMVDEL
jgi:lipopolysaccharide transport system permease protein